MKKRVTKDFETRSKCDLKKAGAYKYSLDPSTQPTCLGFKIWGEPKCFLLRFETINKLWAELPKNFTELWSSLIEEKYEFSAHNSFFERCIYDNILVKRYGWPEIDPRLRRCTAAKAASCALPRNLEGAGSALQLKVQKDRRGYSAMMATCKPTKKWKAWEKNKDKKGLKIEIEPSIFLEPEHALDVWKTLYDYCKIDVQTEELLDDTLPDLIPQEQEIWHLNQELNWRGLKVDIPTVSKVVGIMAAESKKKLKELDSLTMGLVTKPGATKSILDFLALEGVKLPNVRAKTVEEKLSGFELSKDMRRLLELRKALSLTSTRKYQTFLDRASNEDHRIRDIIMYHGASTGRDTGVGIQPHNFPRGLIKIDEERPYACVENVIECDPDMLNLLYGESLPLVFSSILRNMIIPSKGSELFVGDFSNIEVATLWWLSDNTPGLEVLRKGLDPYRSMAVVNTGMEYEQILKDSDERNLGKAQVLGCGFGMGWEKFQLIAKEFYGLQLSDEQAKTAVQNYRKENSAVPFIWKAYENAAINAVEADEGFVQESVGKCTFYKKDKFLWIRLPSLRTLAYREPQISWRETDYGPRKTLEFWAVNSKTKKWGLERTWGGTITENIVQAAARDLMMNSMINLRNGGYNPLLMVHDEDICERKKGSGTLKEFIEIMCQVPPWAEGLPIKAHGWVGPRYRK